MLKKIKLNFIVNIIPFTILMINYYPIKDTAFVLALLNIFMFLNSLITIPSYNRTYAECMVLEDEPNKKENKVNHYNLESLLFALIWIIIYYLK